MLASLILRLSRMSEISLTAKPKNNSLQIALAMSNSSKKVGSDSQGVTLTSAQLKLNQATGKLGSCSRFLVGDKSVILIGVGDGLSSPADYRDFGGALSRAVNPEYKTFIDVPIKNQAQLEALVEGLMLGNHKLARYKSSATNASFEIIVSSELAKSKIDKPLAVSKHVNFARDLINTPANDLWPDLIAKAAAKEARQLGVKSEVWDEKRLAKEKCGGILAVGSGSNKPPRLVKLSYGTRGPKIALVGKGITFDTGGLSLKPADSMVGMKYDMAGAASVLAAMLIIAELKIPARVEGYLCLAENMPSGSATRPGDVIKIRNGKTVEVLNTDAEGRLVLADGLALAMENDPDHVIDIATLTGAATIALGNRYAAVMGKGKAVAKSLVAAQSAGELLWEMPMPTELRSLLDSEIADLTNAKIGNRAGGMLVGAHFLAEFVNSGKKPLSWAHFDIAGPGNNSGPAYGSTPPGASGVMIRTLVELVEKLASER